MEICRRIFKKSGYENLAKDLKKSRYENMSKDFAKNNFLTISVISCLRFSASLASPDKSIYGYLGQQTSRKQIFPTKR